MIPKTIKHKRQETSHSCGAASFAMLLGIPESEARVLVKTKSTGTNTTNVLNAFKNKGVRSNLLVINKDAKSIDPASGLRILDIIKTLSFSWPMYISCDYISNSGRGRNWHRHHAIAVVDGKIYDPSEQFEVPVEAYEHTFNRALYVKQIVLIEEERPLVPDDGMR